MKYYGKICDKHPSYEGLRYRYELKKPMTITVKLKSGREVERSTGKYRTVCAGCSIERTSAYRQKPDIKLLTKIRRSTVNGKVQRNMYQKLYRLKIWVLSQNPDDVAKHQSNLDSVVDATLKQRVDMYRSVKTLILASQNYQLHVKGYYEYMDRCSVDKPYKVRISILKDELAKTLVGKSKLEVKTAFNEFWDGIYGDLALEDWKVVQSEPSAIAGSLP